ncbi:hypothetical protein [Hoeflea ulvae]|uniref:Uncharacterized protein n=1 Tax=Hoeflea ulvae TaxID=2983764 RepID=A0ABT3YF08_9HYPH|nr:hypothetical protein [Hoeflea ulvae]MCY0094247.1 hypothetical protein [Hoeflea ulvae]
MKDALHVLDKGNLPVRKTIRRARWFIASFRDFLGTVENETQRHFSLDDAKLMSAFTAWFRAFEAQKYKAKEHRLEYVTFAAGLMLRELVRHAPVTVEPASGAADAEAPAGYWPEGYLYVTFCLAVREAVIEQDFSLVNETTPELGDLRTWWSFRENSLEDINMAVGFFERFAGETPNWSMPGLFLPQEPENQLSPPQ